MSFNVGDAVNSLAARVLNQPAVLTIARNPIYTAVAIAVIIMLIVAFIYRESEPPEDATALGLIARVGFWSFIIFTGVIFLHNKVLTTEHKRALVDTATADSFAPPVSVLEDAVPISPAQFAL